MRRIGYEPARALENPSATTVSIAGTRQLLSYDQLLAQKYPRISKWVTDYIEMQSPSMRKVLLQKGISNALLSTMETVQSAYVAPSVSGVGPAKQMLTEWWFNPIWGQPRMTDIKTLKTLARGHIGSMCVEAILDQIMQVEWDVIPKWRHQINRPVGMKQSEAEQKVDVWSFLEDPNRNHDNWDKLLRMMLRNVLETDDGVFVKVFEEYTRPPVPNVQIASTGDVRSYTAQPAWDQVPMPGSPLIEVYAEDGSSFLKQTDMHGYLMNYWQYSFVVPRRPVRFETNEIMYVMQNPRAGSPYGYSPFDSLVDTLTLVGKAFTFNEHFYENSAIPALQFDYPWIKSVEELEAMGKYIEENFMGPEKSYRTIATQGGVKVTPISVNPRDLQNLELQDAYIKLVLAKLKVPPTVLGLPMGASGRGGGMGGAAAAQQQAAVQKSRAIKPLITLIENALNHDVIPAILGVSPADCLVEFRWGDMIDLDERERQAKIDQVYLATGVSTVNETRQRDQMDPVPWGDVPFIPAAGLTGGLPVTPKPTAGGAGGSSPSSSDASKSIETGSPGVDMGRDAWDRATMSTARTNVESIAPAGGNTATSIPGGLMKNAKLQSQAQTLRDGLTELTKEVRDRLIDHESYESIEKDVVPRARNLINSVLAPKTARGHQVVNDSLGDFIDAIAKLGVLSKTGDLN
jgi:hypothetical protein